jgi:hypothetical protein
MSIIVLLPGLSLIPLGRSQAALALGIVLAVEDDILLIVGTIPAELSLGCSLGPSLRLSTDSVNVIAKIVGKCNIAHTTIIVQFRNNSADGIA